MSSNGRRPSTRRNRGTVSLRHGSPRILFYASDLWIRTGIFAKAGMPDRGIWTPETVRTVSG
ncbi:MAG: hypothetical protein MI923_04485 [Phycisphaerales bacterium]|nr:hypothetical protein [Phycisphaerales bacterium]